ncbi:MAG: Pr6Pr family membrane protein [Cellulomonas sp.]
MTSQPPSVTPPAPAGRSAAGWARVTFGATAALVTYGLVLQLVLAANNEAGRFANVPDRIVNTLSFFTVESNILVAVTTALLAVRLTRPSTLFRVLRLTAVIAISITGVVFHLALANLQELSDREAVADWILHTASPVLCVVGWLVFGPRGQVTRRVAGLCVTFPVVWLAYTLIRGELVQDRFGRPYYPYPFLDVAQLGYARVLINIALVAALFGVLAWLAQLLDRRLARVRALQVTA